MFKIQRSYLLHCSRGAPTLEGRCDQHISSSLVVHPETHAGFSPHPTLSPSPCFSLQPQGQRSSWICCMFLPTGATIATCWSGGSVQMFPLHKTLCDERGRERKPERDRQRKRIWDKKRERGVGETEQLPQAVLPVHRHVHLVDSTLRYSTSGNQQTHTCKEEEEG